MEISRHTDGYNVEWVKWRPEATGYRAVITEFESVYRLFSDFYTDRKYPEFSFAWTRFDVEDYSQKLIFRFLDKYER